MKNRKSNRWRGYDYSTPGLYFVTICTKNRQPWFGEIRNGVMGLNTCGIVAHEALGNSKNYYDNVDVDCFVVMPDHVHAIICMRVHWVGAEQCSAPTGNAYGQLSKIVKSYKEFVTKCMRNDFGHHGFAWQRSFHDRVIRSERELWNIRAYIKNNPIMWGIDELRHA